MIGGNIAAMPRAHDARGVVGALASRLESRLAARLTSGAKPSRVHSIARFGHGSAIFLLGLLIAALYGAVLSVPDATRGPDRGRPPISIELDGGSIGASLAPPPGAGRLTAYWMAADAAVNQTLAIAYPSMPTWLGVKVETPSEQGLAPLPYTELAAIAPAAGSPITVPVPSLDPTVRSFGAWLSRQAGSNGFLIEAFADSVRIGTQPTLAFGGVPMFELGAAGEPHARLGSVEALELYFDAVDYNLEDVRTGDGLVPRRYVASLPPDLDSLESADERKALFIKAVLPVVLRVNEDIAVDRERLSGLAKSQARGRSLSLVDHVWLEEQFERYDVEAGDIRELLQRIDIIPPSLALAQAAEESGWGTSRFAREGNALFGQYTDPDGPGILPQSRDAAGKYRIRSYDSLYETVRSYALNLNQHRAYEKFRDLRAELRANDGGLDGHRLAGTLTRYSERGRDYVKTIRIIMRENALGHFDDVRLNEQMVTLNDGRRTGRSS